MSPCQYLLGPSRRFQDEYIARVKLTQFYRGAPTAWGQHGRSIWGQTAQVGAKWSYGQDSGRANTVAEAPARTLAPLTLRRRQRGGLRVTSEL